MRNYPTSDNIVMGCNSWWASKFFGDEEVKMYKAKEFTMFPQLLKELEIVDSTSEARRNGWDKEIPYGFSEHWYGQHYIGILNVDMNIGELFYLRFIAPYEDIY